MSEHDGAASLVRSDALLACPFCGCQAMTEGGGTSRRLGKLPLTISCSSRVCPVSPSVTGTRPTVIERWNTRRGVAQGLERRPYKPVVGGSIPPIPTNANSVIDMTSSDSAKPTSANRLEGRP